MTTKKEVLGSREWPYGPNVNESMRPLLLDWAEQRGVRLASRTTDIARFIGRPWSDEPFGWQSKYAGRSFSYWDHPTFWIRGGKPALILVQPYDSDRNWEERARAEAERLGLIFRVSADHWYRFNPVSTIGYEFWVQDPDA